MGRTPKFDYRIALETELQWHPDGISLDQLLERSGLAADRSTLFRHLSRLIREGRAERIGNARASRYRTLATRDRAAPEHRPVTAPEISGGNASLFESYQPNLTPYLQEPELLLLRSAGSAGHASDRPGSYASRVYKLLEPDLCHASAQLAGCSYTPAETEALLENGAVLSDRDPREAVLILNHREALHQVVDALSDIDLTGQLLLRLHAVLGKTLAKDDDASAAGAAAGDQLPIFADTHAVERLAAKLLQIAEPFEQAFCALLFLHASAAFRGNDRGTCRIAVNIPLLKHDLCPISFIGVGRNEWNAAYAPVEQERNPAALKTLFMDAYLRSSERYRLNQVLAEPAPPPMPDYSVATRKAVRTIVREWKRCNRVNLEIYLSLLVNKEHLKTVADTVEHELANLHPGNLAEFALTPEEFACFTPPVAIVAGENT